MKYIEIERQKAIRIRDQIFRDPGNGIFFGKEREFVLSEPLLNLWEGIRFDVKDYFEKNGISWWSGNGEPTGHLLSSQVACVNHLYPFRQRKDCIDKILQNINSEFVDTSFIDSGYIEFEKTGVHPLGKEKSVQRGANSTSIDSFMIAQKENDEKVLILIEWKYTESYTPNSILNSKSGTNRLDVYKELLEKDNCPIITKNLEDLFYEPYYQLMRQTLLGWTMTQNKEYGATDWLHIHVIPEDNKELRERITSSNLEGKTLEESWKLQLKNPDKYIVISPQKFLEPINELEDTKSITNYLTNRYWTNE
ncbi:PGN_0703 family putative restriction endonuclease [Alkalitalea saponilacus]|uniref:PD-(D/E)XK nuclease superfamily protein n=1 Tax=Alkalitalea saponilacus TaxID=889453 RepID=A0A1T5DWN5_9BACT|nr:hypothetical protein [Alkalitalea saponilacus]ASB49163.1 hypothetical protein CDL62_08420 [Alkalitalea saponilacus]SKB76049.1 hypothetical protein SAMN03080601_01148 [Alkalitalea saponilacus]